MSDTGEDVRTSFNHDFARATLLLEPILLPAENAAIAIQRAAAQDAQLKHRQLAKEYKELKIAFEQLRSLKIAPETRTVGLTGQDQLIAWAGGRFAVMNEWFFDPYILDFPMPPDFTAATSLTRYTDPTSAQEGLVAELWSSLSTDLRDALANADRHAEFNRIWYDTFKQSRYDSVSKPSGRVHQVFSKLQPGHRRPNNMVHRENIHDLQSALKWPGETEYTPFPPLAYPGGIRDVSKVLMNPELALLLKLVLFGPSAALDNKKATRKTRGKLWKVDSIGEGAVSGALVLAMFFFSPDDSFVAVGEISRIPYRAFQGLIKTFLLRMSEENRNIVFAWYAREVFGSDYTPMESSGTPTQISSGHDAIEALLASMASVTLAPPPPEETTPVEQIAPIQETTVTAPQPPPLADTPPTTPSIPTSRQSVPRPRQIRRAPSVSADATADTSREAGSSAAAPRATRSRTTTRPSRGTTRG